MRQLDGVRLVTNKLPSVEVALDDGFGIVFQIPVEV